VAAVLFGRSSIFVDQGLFFSGAAVVTFGGAYAVLAYVAQQAVNVYGWLAPGEMVRGLALAETTPGPLVMVVQFVAFVGAYRAPGGLDPWVAAVLAALLTTWVTFVPCFLFILLGAPYVERLRGNQALSTALTGITAAVVGVIASLAVFFALHTLFDDTSQITRGPFDFEVPVVSSIQWAALAITGLGCALIFWRGWSVLRTLGACAVAGIVVGIITAV
jgi:chromate transporter